MPKANASKVWPTSWTWQQVATEMEKKAPSRAKLYRALHTHEYMTTETVVKAAGKNPKVNSDQTTILGMLRELRNQGLIVSELVEQGGKGGKMKHKKCAKPLAIPQESPKKALGKRSSVRRKTRKKGLVERRMVGGVANGDRPAPAAPVTADHPDPLSNIHDGLVGLRGQVEQLTSLVEAEMEREAAEVESMEKMAAQLNQQVAARKAVRAAGRKNTRH